MVQFRSIFSQVLKISSRSDFERAVKTHKSDRAVKGFDCWRQSTNQGYIPLPGKMCARPCMKREKGLVGCCSPRKLWLQMPDWT
jgi:hypothetical protein